MGSGEREGQESGLFVVGAVQLRLASEAIDLEAQTTGWGGGGAQARGEGIRGSGERAGRGGG